MAVQYWMDVVLNFSDMMMFLMRTEKVSYCAFVVSSNVCYCEFGGENVV